MHVTLICVPQKRELVQPGSDPENLHMLKNRLFEAWKQLPQEHQATVLLVLLEKLMEGNYKGWIKEAISLRLPVETDLLAAAFPSVLITRDDLRRAHLYEDDIAQLTDEDLHTISQTMREHYIHDVFWPELAYVANGFLEEKTRAIPQQAEVDTAQVAFQKWMEQVDDFVQQIAGCSVYDLPDCDFYSMFQDGASPAESANGAVSEAGLDLFE